MVYPIYVYGHPVLRKKSVDIEKDYKGLSSFIDNMFETMYKTDGIGLAAPQVGKSVRLFVIDASPFEEDDPSLKGFKKVFINARITERKGEEITFNEGCISIPLLREDVDRPEKIVIEYYDENFDFHKEEYDGVPARIIQHEYDHLEGILFTDKLPALKKRLIKSKLLSIAKGKVKIGYRIVTG